MLRMQYAVINAAICELLNSPCPIRVSISRDCSRVNVLFSKRWFSIAFIPLYQTGLTKKGLPYGNPCVYFLNKTGLPKRLLVKPPPVIVYRCSHRSLTNMEIVFPKSMGNG